MERVDFVVLGATGYTGQYVTKCLEKINKPSPTFTWGVAGRSKEKLQKVLSDLAQLGMDTSKMPVFECDVEKEESLKDVAKKAKIIINCTGPNTLLSEPIVKACIDSGAHYLDISAELNHILNIYRKYHKAAEDNNVMVVPACGFAAIPIVTGFFYLEKQFEGTLESVECFMQIELPKGANFPGPNKCLVHSGTWESLVHVLQHMKEYQNMKKETFPEPLEPGPPEMQRSFFHRNNGKVWFPYPGPDQDIVEMSQRYLYEKKGKKPIPFHAYATMPKFFHFIIIPFLYMYFYLCYFGWFRKMLWTYPKLFTLGYMSHDGPSEKNRKGTKFSFTFVGKGTDRSNGDILSLLKKSLTVKVSGCDPGYETTAATMVFSAITMLRDSNKMPSGGVLNAGAAFYGTDIIDRLTNNGLKYEIVSEKSKTSNEVQNL